MPDMQIGFGQGTLHTPGTLENVLSFVLNGLAAYGGAVGQRQASRAAAERQQQEFGLKQRQFQQQADANRIAHEDRMTSEANRQNEFTVRRFSEEQQAAAAAMQRTADREATNARQQAGFDFRKNVEFPFQEGLRRIVPPGTSASVDAANQRAAQYRAERIIRQLQQQGVLSPTNPDGTPNPDYERQYQQYYEFFTMTPEEQQVYLEEQDRAAQEEADRVFNEQTLPAMRQQSIQTFGQSPDVRRRMETLQGAGQNSMTMHDIYGVGTPDVLGAKGEVPPLYVNAPDAQGDITRRDPQGNYLQNFEPYRKALQFLNSQTPQLPKKKKPARTPAAPYGARIVQ